MFNRIAGGDTGSNYEHREGVMLVGWDEEWAEAEFEDDEALVSALEEAYSTNWCGCAHDCCGHWKATVGEVTLLGFSKAMLYMIYTQNV